MFRGQGVGAWWGMDVNPNSLTNGWKLPITQEQPARRFRLMTFMANRRQKFPKGALLYWLQIREWMLYIVSQRMQWQRLFRWSF